MEIAYTLIVCYIGYSEPCVNIMTLEDENECKEMSSSAYTLTLQKDPTSNIVNFCEPAGILNYE